MSDPNRTPTKPDTKIDQPSNTENIDLSDSNQNAKALHSTSNEENDDKSTNEMVTNSELENLPNVGEGKDDEKVSPVFTKEKEVSIIDKEKDLGKESRIEISSQPTAKVTVKQNDAPLKETDEQTIAEEEQVSIKDEEKGLQLLDPEKVPATEVSSPPTAEVIVKQNDAPLKETDKNTVVISPLEELEEKKKLTPEETTPKLNKISIWMQEKGI